MGNFICAIGLHSFHFFMQKGVNKYYKCTYCGNRKVKSGEHGYSPIDSEWLKNK